MKDEEDLRLTTNLEDEEDSLYSGDDDDDDDDEVSSKHSFALQQGALRDNNNEDDDEESVESAMPRIVWGIMLLPFLLIAIALTVAYVGRRKEIVFVEVEPDTPGGILEETETVYSRPRGSIELTARIHSLDGSAVYNVTKQAKRQIQNFRQGNGVAINIEIAQHGGHALCNTLGHHATTKLGTPAKDCLRLGKHQVDKPGYPSYYPWLHDETEANLDFVHDYFHYITWRFSHPSGTVSLRDTNWEHDRLVSILVVRDPLTRMLAHDKRAAQRWPALFDTTTAALSSSSERKQQWWAFARSPYTDNFALRVLSNPDCCSGAHTPRQFLQQAKELVERFTIVLDMACLDEGLKAAAQVLGLGDIALVQKPTVHKTPQERIGEEDVYEFLRSKNRLDMEFYEWARTRALVQCP